MRKTLLALLSLTLIALADPTGSTLKIGQKVPDFSLTDQNAKKVSLGDFKGKVVLVTFLYTQCPYPEKCPMLAQKLGKTRDLLDQVESAKGQFQVISITLDPKRDTPEALKKYAQGQDENATNWTFMTGKASEVNKVASLFGVIYYTEKGVIDHNMRTAVIDRKGKLSKLFTGNDWKPGEVAALVRDLADQRP
ncbi:MAG: SCO family protein [Candidatus Eremiobacteraeota bacterium]|nr:SCO family protein [Candidatus Eremiobacteraeota bacterium]